MAARRARRFLALPLLAGALALAPSTAHAGATCSFDQVSRTVGVTLVPGGKQISDLGVQGGTIEADGQPCGASTTTADSIVVRNETEHVGILIPPSDDFAPGFTDEPGSSDEIEIDLDFGPNGGQLDLWTGPSDVLDMALGGDRINFNASERNGVDADLTVRNESLIRVMGTSFAGADFVDASGGRGTGPKPFRSGLRLWLGPGHNFAHGGAGRDGFVASRGNDTFIGGPGKDSAGGNEGNDELEGGPGMDLLSGGPGNDDLRGGPGRDKLAGESGRDRCAGSRQDRVRSCERVG